MAITMQRRQRQATPARWQAALDRALSNGVEVRQLAGSGQWIATSASRPNVAYDTDGVSCDCEAALLGADPVCQHRAAFWHALGVLDRDPEPEPPTPAAPRLAPVPPAWVCPTCGGRGFDPVCTGHDTAGGRIVCECPTCDGSGRVPSEEVSAPLAA